MRRESKNRLESLAEKYLRVRLYLLFSQMCERMGYVPFIDWEHVQERELPRDDVPPRSMSAVVIPRDDTVPRGILTAVVDDRRYAVVNRIWIELPQGKVTIAMFHEFEYKERVRKPQLGENLRVGVPNEIRPELLCSWIDTFQNSISRSVLQMLRLDTRF